MWILNLQKFALAHYLEYVGLPLDTVQSRFFPEAVQTLLLLEVYKLNGCLLQGSLKFPISLKIVTT